MFDKPEHRMLVYVAVLFGAVLLVRHFLPPTARTVARPKGQSNYGLHASK